MRFAVDLHENLVEMPSPVGIILRGVHSSFSDLTSEQRAKAIPPKANRFLANIGAALMKQVFNIAKRQREPDVHHHGEADDFR